MSVAVAAIYDDLLVRLEGSSTLERGQAERVLADVLAHLDETVEAYVRRRHGELQQAGLVNARIFDRLTEELRVARFRAPDLTTRQLRRIVYG